MYNSQSVSTYKIQVLDRVFQIVNLLAEERNGASLTEVAAKLKLTKSTAHRLMMVLEAERYVDRDPNSGRYGLGSRIMELGLRAAGRLDVYSAARPRLQSLMEETGETAHLAVLRDGDVVTLMAVESRQTLRAPRAPGARTPAHCTSLGKSILAHVPAEELKQYLAQCSFPTFTPKTIHCEERLLADLRLVRRRGYAIDDEEWELGLRCLAATVYDRTGLPVAAIGISGPVFRISRERISTLARAVSTTARSISESLGYHLQA